MFPSFQAAVEAEWDISYADLSDTELVEKFQSWCRKTLDDFAPKALTATLLAGFSLQRLEAALQKCTDDTRAKSIASRLISGLSGNLTVETNEKLQQVATGALALTDFLKGYGHRTVDEFELAQPRWREDTTYLERILSALTAEGFAKQTDLTADRHSAETELAELLKDKGGLAKTDCE